jgi:hypothetical protein
MKIETADKGFLTLLLLADLCFITLHLIHSHLSPLGADFSIQEERGYGETIPTRQAPLGRGVPVCFGSHKKYVSIPCLVARLYLLATGRLSSDT